MVNKFELFDNTREVPRLHTRKNQMLPENSFDDYSQKTKKDRN